MELREHRPPTVAEPLDDVHLPERVVPIHPTTDDPSDLLGELVGGTGRREPDLTDVEVEVEVRVVHPVRMVEPERHLHHAAAQRSDMTDEGAEPLVHGGVRVELRIRAFVDRETVHVPVRRRRLHVEERRVEPGELLHRPSLPRVTVSRGHGSRSARWTAVAVACASCCRHAHHLHPNAPPDTRRHESCLAAARDGGGVMTVDVNATIVIERPIDEVSAYAGDPSNAPTWYRRITSAEWETEPPIALGSRITFRARFLGRDLDATRTR